MELKVSNVSLLSDLKSGLKVIFDIDKKYNETAKTQFDKLRDKVLRLDVKQWREKRTLDANAYCWKIISKIADVLTADGFAHTKDDIYYIMLKRYGQQGVAKIPHNDVEKFKRQWKYCEEHETLFDEKAVYFRFWVGSSNYDSKEMYIFIRGICDEAKELGIDTRTPDEIANMISLWGVADEKISGKNYA